MPKETIVDKVRARIETGNAFTANNSKLGKELKKFIDNYEAKSLSATPRGNATKRYEEAKELYSEMLELGYNETATTRRKPRASLSAVAASLNGSVPVVSKSRKKSKAAASVPFLESSRKLSPILEGLNENANENSPLVLQLPKSRKRGPMAPNAKAAALAKRAATLARKRNESLNNLSALFNNEPLQSATRKKRGPMSPDAKAAASAKRAATLASKRASILGNTIASAANLETPLMTLKKRRGKASAALADLSNSGALFNPPSLSSARQPVTRGRYSANTGNWVNEGVVSPLEEDLESGIVDPLTLGYVPKSKKKRSLKSTGPLTEEEMAYLNQTGFTNLPLFYNPYTGAQYAPENDPMPNIERAYKKLHGVLEKAKRNARRRAKAATKRMSVLEGGRRRRTRRGRGRR